MKVKQKDIKSGKIIMNKCLMKGGHIISRTNFKGIMIYTKKWTKPKNLITMAYQSQPVD
jgi:hypothetical protein